MLVLKCRNHVRHLPEPLGQIIPFYRLRLFIAAMLDSHKLISIGILKIRCVRKLVDTQFICRSFYSLCMKDNILKLNFKY